MRNYESEFGTKQSCSYEVRHFYKKLFFNPGICFDQNPFPNKIAEFRMKSEYDLASTIQKIQITQDNEPVVSCRILQEDNSSKNSCCEGFDQVNKMYVWKHFTAKTLKYNHMIMKSNQKASIQNLGGDALVLTAEKRKPHLKSYQLQQNPANNYVRISSAF